MLTSTLIDEVLLVFDLKAEERSRSKSELRNANASISDKHVESKLGKAVISRITQILPDRKKKQGKEQTVEVLKDSVPAETLQGQLNLPFVSITNADTPSAATTDQWDNSPSNAVPKSETPEESFRFTLGVPNAPHGGTNSLINIRGGDVKTDPKCVFSLPASPSHKTSNPQNSGESLTAPREVLPPTTLSLRPILPVHYHNHLDQPNHHRLQYHLSLSPHHHHHHHQFPLEFTGHGRNGDYQSGLRVHPFKFPRHHSVGVVDAIQEQLKETTFKSPSRANLNFELGDKSPPHPALFGWSSSIWHNFKTEVGGSDLRVGNSLSRRLDKYTDEEENEDDIILQELLQPGLLDEDDGDVS